MTYLGTCLLLILYINTKVHVPKNFMSKQEKLQMNVTNLSCPSNWSFLSDFIILYVNYFKLYIS